MSYENAKILKGVIVSHGGKKTAVVKVEQYLKHLKYKKYIKRSKKYKAHDEKDEYAVGDKVSIRETKPISKDKKWVVIKKI
ncbi:MAG: 30S ribosomal protein S17 [Candidatus Niyogibacteria bacterium CG10_big_fil_rev_8_21_14_0_10_42_19]|uniref:Small ribosomal subunit protein uS17 n=1 Tax=Candidatus Niyogibacteria bacterium CG10_big_fil_rev_8_21_14_0_10_42_19 TaxID=1974725 RepID=A0A2H0TFC4_9BACT|nr:MAG: 30S ribosomal protein S17 [Candidatus Niyogibacteria bacterium CG10_big_fil_rev_8_21_14_0_10_42_19]